MKSLLFLSVFSFFLFGASSFAPSESKRADRILISQPIVLKSGDVLDGGTYELADGAECPMIIIGDTELEPRYEVKDIIIRNVKLYGNKEKQKHEIWNNWENHIRNSGIVVRRARNVLIENVQVEDCRSGGIVIERHSESISVINSTSSYNQFDGIAAYETKKSFFSGLVLQGNKFAGGSFDLNFNENLVTDCLFLNNEHQGVFMRFSSRNQFSNCNFKGSNEGVFIAKSELAGSECVGNLFFTSFFSNNKRDFVVNDKECTGNIVMEKRKIALVEN